MRHARIALALACAVAAPAIAACAWEWLCTGDGACRRMPVCDSVHESPPPRAGSRPPAPPPLAMRPFRMARSAGGELSCEHVMRLARDGRWTWREACYCADKSRNPDAARPFAHIVRCDAPGGR